MATTLSEALHFGILRPVRNLRESCIALGAELGTNNEISELKLRQLCNQNANTYDSINANTIAGIGAYATDQLGIADIGATATSTKSAMIAFKDYVRANLPVPTDNGLDAAGRSTLLIVTTTDMPALQTEIDTLSAALGWA